MAASDLQVYRRNVVVDTPGPVRINTDPGILLRQSTATFDALAQENIHEATAGIVADQIEAGRKAGTAVKPDGSVAFDLLPNDSKANRAFNQGAMRSYEASFSSTATSRAAEIAAKNQMDPEGSRRAWDAEVSGRLGAIPEGFKASAGLEFIRAGEGAYRAIVAQKAANDRALQAAEFNNAENLVISEASQAFAKGGTFDGQGASTGVGESYRNKFIKLQDDKVASGFQTESGKILAVQGFDAKMRQGFWMHAFNESAGVAMDRGNIMGGLQAVQRLTAAIRKDQSIPEEEKLRLVASQHHFFSQRASTLMQLRSEGDYQAGQSFTRQLVGVTADLTAAKQKALETGDYSDFEAAAKRISDMTTGGRAALELRREQLKAEVTLEGLVGQQTADTKKTLNAFAKAWQEATYFNEKEGTSEAAQAQQRIINELKEARDNTPEHLQAQMTAQLTQYIHMADTYARSAQKLYEDQATIALGSIGATKTGKPPNPDLEAKYGEAAREQVLVRLQGAGFDYRKFNEMAPGVVDTIMRGTKLYQELLVDTELAKETATRVSNPTAAATASEDVADFMVRAARGKANLVPGAAPDMKKVEAVASTDLNNPMTWVHITNTANFIPKELGSLMDSYARSSSVEAIRKGMDMWQAFESHIPQMMGSIGSAQTQNFFRLMSERAFVSPDEASTMKIANQVREQITAGIAEAPKVFGEKRVALNAAFDKAINDVPLLTSLTPLADLTGVIGLTDLPKTGEGFPIVKGARILNQPANLVRGAGLQNVQNDVIAPPSFRDDVAMGAARRMSMNANLTEEQAVREEIRFRMQAKQGDNPVYGISEMVSPGQRVVTPRPIEVYAAPDTGGLKTIKDAAIAMSIVEMTGRPPGAIGPEMTADPSGRTRLEKEFLEGKSGMFGGEGDIKEPSIVFNRKRMGYEIYFPNAHGALEPVRNYRTGQISLFSAEDFKTSYADPKTGFMYALRRQAKMDATSIVNTLRGYVGADPANPGDGLSAHMGDSVATVLYNISKTFGHDVSTLSKFYKEAEKNQSGGR